MTAVDWLRPVDYAVDLDSVVRSLANVMVTAEEGDRMTWARQIHDGGRPRTGGFVAVFLSTTWQVRAEDVDYWFARAAGGTLFIDRIENLGSQAQDRLSRLLTEQSHHLIDATARRADHGVRLVTGSTRSLGADLALAVFSNELFYRLNVIHIDLIHQGRSGEQVMKARDIMSEPVRTCEPATDLATVARIMWDHDCGFVPVVDASGAVAGVVTDRDICIATATRRLLPEQLSAAQVMTAPIHACLADDSVNDVLAMMKQRRIRRVPVIDRTGRVLGVISLNDLVLASTNKRVPRASDVMATMAAICAHRSAETAVA